MALNNFLPIYESLLTDLKFYHLQDELDIEEDQALMILMRFWFWGSKHADKDGNIGQISERLVDRAIKRPHDPEGICQALVKIGFVDKLENNGLQIHNWIKYAGALIAERERWREVKRVQREKKFQEDMRKAEGEQPKKTDPTPQEVPKSSPRSPEDNTGNSRTDTTLPSIPLSDYRLHDTPEEIGGMGERETKPANGNLPTDHDIQDVDDIPEDQLNLLVDKYGTELAEQIIINARNFVSKTRMTNPQTIISDDKWKSVIALQEKEFINSQRQDTPEAVFSPEQ